MIGSSVAHAIEPRYLLAIGLLLIAIGAGGIKPCVSTNVGDQFGETNKHLLTRVFNWFYFSINAGSFISTLLIPWLLEPYKADPAGFIAKLPPSVVSFLESPRLHSPDIAFGLARRFHGDRHDSFFGWAARNLSIFRRSGLRNYAREIFNKETGKIILNVLMPVPFVMIFWALWQQNFSSWIVQAGEDGSASFRDRMALVADPDGESDFHFDHAADLFLLALSVRREIRSLDAAAENRRRIVRHGRYHF